MAGKSGQGLIGQQQQPQAPPGAEALAAMDQPVTQADLYNMGSQQQGKAAAPVFSGAGDDQGARIAAIRQLLGGGQARQMRQLPQAGQR